MIRPLIRWVFVICFAAVVAGLGQFSNSLEVPFFGTLDKSLGDLRTAVFSPQAATQRPELALVLIDENSIRNYESIAPIRRDLIAKLVQEIDSAGPKAIGLDFIFERATPHTDELLSAIRIAGSPIVLGALDDRYSTGNRQSDRLTREGLLFQEDLLGKANRPVGHLWLERKQGLLATTFDTTIRFVAESNLGTPARDSFSGVVAKAAGYHHTPPDGLISWQRPPGDVNVPLFPEIHVPRHDPTILTDDQQHLLQPFELDLLKDRIVLVGASLSDRDQHAIPMTSLDRHSVPGVAIHAQAIAQRIDATRDVHRIPELAEFAILLAVALTCYIVTSVTGFNPRVVFFQPIAFISIGLASVVAFSLWQLDLPSGSLTFAIIVAALGGYYSAAVFRWLRRDRLAPETTP
jgi:adenylate cyclase